MTSVSKQVTLLTNVWFTIWLVMVTICIHQFRFFLRFWVKKNTNSIQPTKLQKLRQITKLLKFLAFCGLNRVSSLFVHQEIQEKFWKNRVTSVQQRDPTFAKLI